MNTRINKILSVLATIAIVASSFVFTMPVAASTAGDGQFTIQDIPSATKDIILAGNSINDMAVAADGKTIYVAGTVAGSFVLKSADAGQSFETIQNNLLTAAPGFVAPIAIAIAPDDISTIAITDGAMVVISKDGGTTWATLPAPPAGSIRDIAVAPARTGTLLGREYVIAISDPGATTALGDVSIIGNTATWATVATGLTGTRDFTSVAVTPNFLGDRAVVAVGTTPGATTVATTALQIFNTATLTVIQTCTLVAAGASSTTIAFDAAVPANSILSSSIALPTNFDPTTTAGRRAYVGIASVAPTTDNEVYRCDDNTAKALGAVTGAPISAVAFNGTVDTGILFAALRNNNGSGGGDIKYTTGMTATSPTWTTTLKAPSGGAPVNAIQATTTVIWSATAGTYTMNYLDQAGAASVSPAFTIAAASPLGTVVNIPLAAGDTGVTDVTGIGVTTAATVPDAFTITATGTTAAVLFGTVTNGLAGTYVDGAAVSTVPNTKLAVASDYATTSRLFAGTVGIEAAFSVSNDAGVSFVAESLVNVPALGNPALSFSGTNNVFLSSKDTAGFLNIWQSELPMTSTSWKRIYARATTAAGGIALRNNPGWTTTPAMFLFETGIAGGNIYVSQDAGVSWTTRNSPTGQTFSAASVRDAQTLYFCDTTGSVYKSTNAAWTWSTAVAGGVGQIRSITLPKANQVLVGGTTGVAISSDDAATFTAITGGLTVVGTSRFSVQTDSKYADNNIIYTIDTNTAGSNLFRVDASATSNTWTNMGAPQGANTVIGLTGRSGILYLTTNNAGVGVLRSLYPNDLVGNQNWQAVFNALPGVPAAGVTTAAGINLYVRVGAALYAFNDFLATTKPTLTTPADNYNNAVNPAGGLGFALDLKMQPMGTGNGQVDRLDVEIVDKTNGFTGVPFVAGIVISPTNPIVNTGNIGFVFQPNKTYQWRMRAARTSSTQLTDSPWSDARTINVQAGSQVTQQYAGPQLLGPVGASAVNVDPNNVGIAWAPVSGATEYQVIVATDAALTKTVGGTPATTTIPAYQVTGLTEGTTYFYAVKATKPTESIQTVGTFSTRPKAAATTVAPPATQPPFTVVIPGAGEQPTPAYIWAVIAIGAILVIAVIILIVRTRRVP